MSQTQASSSAKTRILQRLRDAKLPDVSYTRAETPPRMPLEGSKLDHFVAKLTSERLTATVDRIDSWSQAAQAAKNYCESKGIQAVAALSPSEKRLQSSDWSGWLLEGQVSVNQQVSITCAEYGVAETGSLVTLSSPAAPLLFAMLPLYHICFVQADKVVAYSEDLWPIVRNHACEAEGGTLPRSLTFITGTSGTADIEAKNVRGAHGPRFLHVVIVG